MLEKALLNSSSSLTEFKIELNEEFNNFYRYVEDSNKFNDVIKDNFENFKLTLDKIESRESALKRRIEDEVNHNKKREKESMNLIREIKDNYDRNIGKLREHHQRKISNIIEKHKHEIQKWKSKYEKVKFDKKIDQVESNDALLDKNFLKTQIEKLNDEFASLKSKNDSTEGELTKIKNQNKSIQVELKDLQKENSKLKSEVTAKDKELAQNKSKIKELETKIKSSEDLLKDKSEKLKTKANELKDLKLRYDNLLNDHAKLNADKKEKVDHKSENKSDEVIHSSIELSTIDELKKSHKQELTVVKCELRAVTRELDRKTELYNLYRREVNDLKAKISESEEKLNSEKSSGDQHKKQIERYQNDLNKKQSEIDNKDEEIMNLRLVSDGHSNNLDLKLKELGEVKKNEMKWKNKCVNFEKKHQLLLNEIECIKRKNAALKVEIDRKNADIEQLTSEKNKMSKSYETLKKVCKDLESQLSQYTQKFTDMSSAKKTLIKQTSSISDERNCYRNDLSLAQHQNKQLKEEIDELTSQLNNKDHKLKNMLTDEKIRYNKLLHEYEIEQDKCKRYEDKIEWLQENVDECDQQLAKLTNECTLLSKELSSIKEEATKHITEISNLQKDKQDLNERWLESRQHLDYLSERISQCEELLDAKNEEIYRERYTCNEKISQQKKLIDFLTKSENKKKPSIFSLNSKSSVDSADIDLAQKALKAEKQKNTQLNEQLNKATLDLDQKVSEVEFLNTQVYELKNQLVQKITSSQKKSVIAHDIPHNFKSIKIKFTTMCVSCANKIYFGQSARKCQDCESTVHPHCTLVNNCGVPVDCVRKAIYENANNSLSSSQLDNLEPSAPEASFPFEEIEDADAVQLELELDRIILEKSNDYDAEYSTDSLNDCLK